MKKLSIITINFNDVNGLIKTIESVVNQSFTDYEFIIIDGGSSDGSAELLKKYSAKITYSVSELDGGIYFAQNKGILAAKGEYCLFLNSGDYLKDNNVLENVFKSLPTEDIIACDMVFNYGEKKFITKSQPDSLSFFYLMNSSLWHPVTFIKRSLFDSCGFYNTNFKIAADYDFFLNATIIKNASYKHLAILVSVFDTTGISSNTNYSTQHKAERLKIQQQYFSNYLISAANEHNDLINSNAFKLFVMLKNKPFIYKPLKIAFDISIAIKRLFCK
jgi:glycosyltransferase involved in cell wall biosynthesis